MRRGALVVGMLAFVVCLLIVGGRTSHAAQKYVGVHYLAWYDSDYEWYKVWDPNAFKINFESDLLPGATTGTAFGTAPRSTAHGSMTGWGDSKWADSFTGGESATGTFTTVNYTLKGSSFSFKAAGYDGASGTNNQNYYYLKRTSDNAVLFSAKPPQSDAFTTIAWNTSAYVNTQVYFQVVDGNGGSSYAWLAVDDVLHDVTAPTVQPAIGFYTSNYATGAAHAATLKAMGVDFAMIDETNNTIWGPGHPQTQYQTDTIYNNTKAIVNGMASVSGGPKAALLLSITTWDGPTTQVQRLTTKNYATGTPYMYYPWIPSNAGDLFLQKVGMVYNDMANDPSKYFYYEGKPLLFLYVAQPATVYDENGVDQTPNGKLPDTWNPVVPNTGGQTIRGLFNIRWVGAIMAGSGNPKYVASTGDTTKAINGHWSWEDGMPQTWAARANPIGDTPEAITDSPFARSPLAGRNGGATFRSMWDRTFDVDPIFAIIHTWNEFSGSGDEPSAEYSQSIEPTANYFTDTYKTAAQNYIAHFKSFRMDYALYDTTSTARRMFLRNRTGDFGSYTFNFGFQSDYAIDLGTSSVEAFAGDFNGDGKSDFGLRNISTGVVSIRYSPYFSQTGIGSIPGEKNATYEAGSRYKMFVGDFNNDGKADIGYYDSVGGGGGPGFIIRYNDGSSNFTTAYTWAWTLSGSYQYGSADINGDGRSDIVYRDPATGTINFALAKTDGLQSKPSSTYSYGWAAGTQYQLFLGNADGNAYHDVGLRDASIGRLYMLQNANTQTGSTWNFTNQQTFDWAAGSQYLPISGDFR